MIKYALACHAEGCGHQFDSWFSTSADYDRLATAGLLSCPSCGGADVGKGIMAPAISRGGRGSSRPVDMIQALREMRRKVEAEGENVGRHFAEEARRIHEGTAPERLIYGDATPEEAEQLREEGVPVASIPWVPLEDA